MRLPFKTLNPQIPVRYANPLDRPGHPSADGCPNAKDAPCVRLEPASGRLILASRQNLFKTPTEYPPISPLYSPLNAEKPLKYPSLSAPTSKTECQNTESPSPRNKERSSKKAQPKTNQMKNDKTKDVIANLTRLPIELLQKAQPWERIGALYIIISANNDEQTQAHAPARKARQPATHKKPSH
jgi:hypothetical protein